jgi:hypothetical protein
MPPTMLYEYHFQLLQYELRARVVKNRREYMLLGVPNYTSLT